MMMDNKKYYLVTLLPTYEYIQLLLEMIPDKII